MDQIEQLKKILEICERRAMASEARLRAALAEQRRAEEIHAEALRNVEQEIQNQAEGRRRNIAQLLAEPADQGRISRIRLQYDLAAEKVTQAQEMARVREEEAAQKAAEAEQRRQEHRELERRRQKISALIEKLKTPNYEKDPDTPPPSSRR